ncbi:CaiB/BaiF CoA transferase family protein [Sphingopyxis sp.]|uniref:CaiB/BaiF CoA transferase family protein n=1 Tax=Sphingopyxis sp. TaxID=1908224 RepID=UPI003D6D0A9D
MMGPLDGLVVIDLTSVVAGPLATQLLAQQGARVIKVEPKEGDRARMLGAIVAPGFSSVHVTLNAGKQSVSLDLGKAAGVAALLRLVERADILVHNFRPGVMERLGLPVETLRSIRPDLIIARITGFGQTGPLSGERAYDPIVQAEAAMTVRNEAGEPRLAPQYICDKTTGLYAAQAITAAVAAYARTGKATVVDISMLEAAVAFGWIDIHSNETFAEAVRPQPDIAAVYRPWPTRDGWVVIVMLSDAEFAGWAAVVGAGDRLDDPCFKDMTARFLNWDRVRALGEAALSAMSTKEAVQQLRAAGVPCGIANTSAMLRDIDQLTEDGFLVEADDDRLGRVTTPLPAARFDGFRRMAVPASAVGAETRAVLAEHGFDSAEIDALFESRIAHTAPE